ncbi:PorP/SprF family type IX secretion system membrane protein [Flavihumibacter rivuli]|uniref:PorP/SprF family type IX secretion system membrane protein n=1 Tax=Flavihumibacter rivuli TaxID=2838156 RepID=UPI001BDEE822|nr:PorP/SprF family type IX secretion system membrane protein [Flavihumibacter rivuli]ULQ55042.1 PorP/SprF family type IX secretion system membrane protein [Flavihumibacter rivuli]
MKTFTRKYGKDCPANGQPLSIAYCRMAGWRMVVLPLLFLLPFVSKAQDPNFSQFFSSPLNVNPALTGNIIGDWRTILNFRNQWIGPTAPYMTGTISGDAKIMKEKLPDGQRLGVGAMFMYDKTMAGVLRSTYASANVAYNILVAEGYGKHYIGAGFGLIYGHRRMDWTRVVFGEQYKGNGFDVNLPTGESSLSAMKPYVSMSAGGTYSYQTEYSNFDLGFAAFHLNKPKQTFLEDENQRLPTRFVVHANYEKNLNDQLVLTTNGIYQRQTTASYFSVGGGLGVILDEMDNKSLSAGLWYWSKNAIVPYLGFSYKQVQFGLSYDVLISKLKDSPGKRSTWEFSIVFRDLKNIDGIMYCPPWK